MDPLDGAIYDFGGSAHLVSLFATSAFEYREHRAHYDSHSGATIHCYAQSCERRPLLHINRDRSQRYSIMLLDKE